MKLEPFGAFTSMWDYLAAPPTGPETVPLSDYFSVPAKLGKALFDSFYPFVQNSEWFNDQQTNFAPLFRALAPLLCPSCTPGKPVYDNPWLYEHYPPNQQTATLAAATAPEANTGTLANREEKSESSHPVKDAVTGLLKKFELAKNTGDATAPAAAETGDEVAGESADAAPVADTKDAADTPTETTSATKTDTESATDTTDGAAESAKPAHTGLFGKHRKSNGDDTNSVTSIRDKVSSSATTEKRGSSSATGASGASDKGSSDTGSSNKGSGGAE